MTKGRVAGSSLSYSAAQNIAPQDLFGGHYAESFTEPKSRIQLHKITIKTEMNKDKKKKQQQQQRLLNCSCTSDAETYSRVFPNLMGNSYNSPRYCCSVFHRDNNNNNNNNKNTFFCIAVYTKALYRFTIKKRK